LHRKYQQVPMIMDAKITSWRDDRSVWIEVNSNTTMPKPLNAVDHDSAEVVFDRGAEFLKNEIIPMLHEFDSDRKE